ncbi:hypothetical protein [Vitiosangium sp. GDMCC 1.1324]|uniref:hypothetical protein n=1 Tax=Vitiosangium sp. (strain GDMCC 1.1324) TaxID=2138576 RepID=UPI000D39AE96|nr:hypothetical protein [Vitiosangium sp. GDMCC 1.1324]PTL77560.1 hypothetical protein DAT35_42905 [Vitiosangium sp. GDMCC 1.1324]
MSPEAPRSRRTSHPEQSHGLCCTLLCLLLLAGGCAGVPGEEQEESTPEDLTALVAPPHASADDLYFEVLRLHDRGFIPPGHFDSLRRSIHEQTWGLPEQQARETCRTLLLSFLRRTLRESSSGERSGELAAELEVRGHARRMYQAGVREAQQYAEATVLLAGVLGIPTSKGEAVLMVATAGRGFVLVKLKMALKRVPLLLRELRGAEEVVQWASKHGHRVQHLADEAALRAAVKAEGGELTEAATALLNKSAVQGAATREVATQVARVWLSSRRSADEVAVLARAAMHSSHERAAEVEALWRRVAGGGILGESEWTRLEQVAQQVDKPLREAAEALRAGKQVPWLGLRAMEGGRRMELGSAEHQAQCWLEYQLRNSERFKEFSYQVDETWLRKYRAIMANKPQGDGFELLVLQTRGYEKNVRLVMPPPGTLGDGFVPDAFKEQVEHLVWGRPYKFVEVKSWNELSMTGNVKAMIDYIDKYGGYLELWVRSPAHSSGPTHLSVPLKRAMERLRGRGLGNLELYP